MTVNGHLRTRRLRRKSVRYCVQHFRYVRKCHLTSDNILHMVIAVTKIVHYFFAIVVQAIVMYDIVRSPRKISYLC